MSYLNSKWKAYHSQPLRPRSYASQREFEADRISGMRRRYRISQDALAALAALASVSVTTIQNWENSLSRKAIAAHNQDRLRDIERDLWIKAQSPCSIPARPPSAPSTT